MKKVVRLNEGQLNRIIKESVKRILRENFDNFSDGEVRDLQDYDDDLEFVTTTRFTNPPSRSSQLFRNNQTTKDFYEYLKNNNDIAPEEKRQQMDDDWQKLPKNSPLMGRLQNNQDDYWDENINIYDWNVRDGESGDLALRCLDGDEDAKLCGLNSTYR